MRPEVCKQAKREAHLLRISTQGVLVVHGNTVYAYTPGTELGGNGFQLRKF